MSMDKKNNLLEAATIIFAEKGYKNASVDEIVEKADVAKGTFYYHFKSKEDLFLSLIDAGIEKLSDKMITEANKYHNPIQKVEAVITSQYKFFNTNQDICQMLLSEIWHTESKWKQVYIEKRNRYIQGMEQSIISGQENNLFDDKIDAKTAAVAIFGLVATSALDHATAGKKVTPTTIKMITKIATNGLMAC